jgi:hypothetical protein
MKPNGQDEPKFVHSLAVLRFIVKKMPQSVGESEMSTLMALLSHLNLSNYQEKDLAPSLTVFGSASESQIAGLTHYDESSVRAKLKGWRRLGHVDWTKRVDNRGSDFTVCCTPNPDVISKCKVDPKRSEQARKAQLIRWEKKRSASVDTPSGCASLDAESAKSDSTGALNEIRTGVSRLAPLELLSGTLSATSSGTGNRAAEQANTDKTDRSKTTTKATPAPLKDSVPETQPGASRRPDPSVGISASRSPVAPSPKLIAIGRPAKDPRWTRETAPLTHEWDNRKQPDFCSACCLTRAMVEGDAMPCYKRDKALDVIWLLEDNPARSKPTASARQFREMTGAVDVDRALHDKLNADVSRHMAESRHVAESRPDED